MYLTQILVDGISLYRNHIYDNYCWKKELYKAFPTKNKENKDRPFLFRVMDYRMGQKVLVLSQTYPVKLPYGTWATKLISNNFYAHKGQYLFDILANPTKKSIVRDTEGRRKKQGNRVPIPVKEYSNWITGKLTGAGCVIKSLEVLPLGSCQCQHKGTKATFAVAQFRGTLTVNNQIEFTKAATEGVGSAKSFGYGLLLLKRV